MKNSEPVDPVRQTPDARSRQITKRYYFDVDDGDAFHSDDQGMELSYEDQIASEAYEFLKQIVYHKCPEGRRTMTARVRDGSGKIVYEGTMTINGRRFTP